MSGKWFYLALTSVLLCLIVAAMTACTIQENRRLQKESSAVEESLNDIYLILAQQGSQMRLIMNTALTRDHWAKHADKTPQMDCPECLRIYQGIAEQTKELEDAGLPKNAIHEQLKGLGYKSILESKEGDTNANQ